MAQPPDSPTPVRDIAAGARPPLALDPALPRGMFFLLAIAIDGYTGFNPLRNAVNGARSLAAVLQRKFGFASERVRMLLETAATRDNILKVLREVILALGEHDSLVVYYAGHGHLDRELQIGYWIPVHAEQGN